MTLTLRVLGCGTPYPTPGKPCSGYLLEASGVPFLVECGLGVWASMLERTDPARLAGIWISHLHADHWGDLLAAYQWALNTPGAPQVPVFGPPGWAVKLGAVLPVDDGEGQLRRLFAVREHTSGPAELAEAGLHLAPVPVRHSVPAWGVQVRHAGRTLGYSGDTGPCSGLAEIATGADVFLCEAGAATSGQEYHCSPEEAAVAAGAARLILTHLAPGLSPADASKRAGGALVAAPGELHVV